MSSRGQFVGSGPVAGIYQPTPVPAEPEDLAAYVNDELLSLGGRLNSVFEGGAFPPQSEMPRRWRDGMMIYFTQALPDTYPNSGEVIIPSAGVWLFKKDKWWKIIDDPTDIVGGLTYYCLKPNATPPEKPQTGPDLPPVSVGSTWEEVPPEKPDKSYYIFSTTLVSYTDSGSDGVKTYEWSIPTIWSGGVVDGNDGDPGAPGIDGRIYEAWHKESATQPFSPDNVYPPGDGWTQEVPASPTNPVWVTYLLIAEDGTNPSYPWSFPLKITGEDGVEGRRGSIHVSIQGTSWSSQAAYDAIANEPSADGNVYNWDTVTITDIAGSTQFSETRYYAGGGNPGTWNEVEVFIDGDVIVNGTIGSDQIAANAITAGKIAANAVTAGTISAGAITANEIAATADVRIGGTGGDDWVILSPDDPDSRIWVGPSTGGASANFRVAPDGTLYANNGYFGGEVTAKGLTGTVAAAAYDAKEDSGYGTFFDLKDHDPLVDQEEEALSIKITKVDYEREIFIRYDMGVFETIGGGGSWNELDFTKFDSSATGTINSNQHTRIQPVAPTGLPSNWNISGSGPDMYFSFNHFTPSTGNLTATNYYPVLGGPAVWSGTLGASPTAEVGEEVYIRCPLRFGLRKNINTSASTVPAYLRLGTGSATVNVYKSVPDEDLTITIS